MVSAFLQDRRKQYAFVKLRKYLYGLLVGISEY